MKAKLSLLIPLLTIVGLVACTAAIPVSSTSTTVATTSTTTTTVAASPMPIIVDANGVEIGYRAGIDEIYVPSIKRIIVYPLYTSYSPTIPIEGYAVYYATTDCSGIGYTAVSLGGRAGPKLYAYNSYNGPFTVADDTAPTLIKPLSVQSLDGTCDQSNAFPFTQYLAVEYVILPFNIPLAYPFKFKQ